VILVDSSVWVDFFRGTITPQTTRLDGLLGQQPIVIGDLILAEVLQGFDSNRDYAQALKLFRAFEWVTLGGGELALAAAQNFRALREKGITVRKTIDTVIATYCIANDCALLYSDRDFDPFVEYLGLRSALES
jgi:predicted nucleic acid-binding protein